MKTPEQTEAIQNTLVDYAKALNTADIAAIPAFYTNDGKFMPEGHKTITNAALLKKAAGNHLVKSAFHIEYIIEDIIVEDEYAFVLANAKTLQKEGVNGTIIGKTSRDFFILRKVEETWKICRYIFNNVNPG